MSDNSGIEDTNTTRQQPVRLLSLWEPWATLCVLGAKRYETRSWKTNYVGWVGVHSAKNNPKFIRNLPQLEPFKTALDGYGTIRPFDRGHIIGTVYLDRCSDVQTVTRSNWEEAFGDYSEGRYAWQLRDAQIFREPIPCRGSQGLWTPSEEMAAEVLQRIGAYVG